MRTLLIHKPSLIAVVAVGAFSASVSCNTYAQAPNPAGANAQKFGVAVVDIPYVFKNYQRFSTVQDAMKKEMEKIDADVKGDRANIAKTEQQRNSFKPGTEEYKKLDEDLARMMAEFQLKTSKLQKDFMERQAKVYYQTYLEVVAAVDVYAKRHNIGLVMRFNGEAVDPNNRQAVMQDINKHVVVQNNIDITPDVLMLLNRDQPPRTTAQPGAQIPPR